jgi:hypothetical protein
MPVAVTDGDLKVTPGSWPDFPRDHLPIARARLALVELNVMEPRMSPNTRPGIQHGKNRFRALLGRGNRGIDIYVVLPERVHHGVLTAYRANDTVAALSFPLLGEDQRAMHPHPQRVRCHQGVLQPGWLIGHQPHIVDDLIEPAPAHAAQ